MQNSDDGNRSEDVTRYLGNSFIFSSPNLHLKISCEKVEKTRVAKVLGRQRVRAVAGDGRRYMGRWKMSNGRQKGKKLLDFS
ncbi:uncharacterized [Tachysurus ichikawai]